jgi:hypothetical protein
MKLKDFVKRLCPSFLKNDYSPYKCGVSSNRENYDFRARMIHFKNLLKTWVNTSKCPFFKPVECKKCLFDTRIPNIYIGPDGLCNMCMTYEKNFNMDILNEELKTFFDTPSEEGARYDAVVAFSGGKDSSISLYLARKKYNLNVVAILVDNGFIPAPVIDNGRAFCDKLGVDLVVLPIRFAGSLKSMIDNRFKNGYPCNVCTKMFHERIRDYCIEHRINRVILGRNWWRWLEPEVRAVRWVTDENSGLNMQFISLPFALRLTREGVMNTLEDAGWSPVNIHGNSTNCLIPGLVEHTIYKRLGYHPELNLLSREVIAGYLSKQEARADLKDVRNMTPELMKIVEEKLNDQSLS